MATLQLSLDPAEMAVMLAAVNVYVPEEFN
jgi:hypothetical protein